MIKGKNSILAILLFISTFCSAQNVPILNYSINNFGQAQLEIEGQADQYYLLTALHEPNLNYESITSMTLGVDGSMIISEPLGAFPLQNYKITAHSIAAPDDADGDGIDDITEFNDLPTNSPLNFAEAISFIDGTTSIDNYETFESLAVVADVPWAPFLNGQQFVKFGILDRDTDEPKVYFINSNTHFIHDDFFSSIPAVVNGDDGSGEIVFNPNEILPNGSIGSYSFNFSFGDALNFEATQRTLELLVANMPYLNNNMQHFIGAVSEDRHLSQYADDFVGSRVNVVFESDVFGDIDYIPFNEAEGFGFFRQMTLDENPGSRDIVLYDALPNSLPRVGGIITSVVQTPLSHVNLRAIQDNVPNAYIKDPLLIDSISNLIGKYIYYKVENESYSIREATLEEVNEWYEKLRPTEDQIPERDLSFTEILPLDSIQFDMATAFGAKCSNVATMRNFGFPDNTIPDGFGIPFYYYDEFMKFNGFYQQVEEMLADSEFNTDLEVRIETLKDFRTEIKAANMPQWMLDDLQNMHDAFPEGTAVRCRSSTNNEDLPGFSGAGLYTSKTQHLDEGHISKSIKQVYASMWNFRAYDEREFYRVDQYIAAMGVLCHPNYQEEKSNGVGVSIDPIYQTENTFYLNTQVGESLITNPDPNAVPEEILLNIDPAEGYFVLRNSNLVNNGELVMSEEYLNQMRDYLKVIHDEFEILYNVVGAEGFGMDIEYKVTAEDQLIIKQARPWVSFWSEINANFDLEVVEIVNPSTSASIGSSELVTAKIANRGLKAMKDFELSLLIDNQFLESITITDELLPLSSGDFQFILPQDFSAIGDYNVEVIVSHPSDGYDKNDTLNTVISKLHLIEGGITAELEDIKCGNELVASAKITNYGETTFSITEIEVVVNGMIVDTVSYGFSIPYLAEVSVPITITENLQLIDNMIQLNLVKINGQQDAVNTNNSSNFMTDLNSDFDKITLVIVADDYPQETSWELYNTTTNELVESGGIGNDGITQDICVDYNDCFSLFVFDSAFDGLCCGYGFGNFSMLNADGELIFYNNGEFFGEVEEMFCPGDIACPLTVSVSTSNASTNLMADGWITINAANGIEPYEYSIDGGLSFGSSNVFINLLANDYEVVVVDSDGCRREELVTVDYDLLISVEDLSFDNIKLYPNPTQDNFILELDDNFSVTGDVNVSIYDNLGRVVHTTSLNDSYKKATISLENYNSGSYIAKCYNQDFERYFKVIKID